MYIFDAEKETKNCISWIKNWFENKSGDANGVIIGISGGKDSTIVASLCCEAIGRHKVFGVLMPNGVQHDIADSKNVCKILGILNVTVDINGAYQSLVDEIMSSSVQICLNELSLINIAPRLRMTTLYTIGQALGCRVAGTGNLSEKYVGYCTKWGDMACDFNPIANFTKTEVVQIGDCLKLPHNLIHKIPSDGLSGLSDEDNMKITYEALDNWIRTKLYREEDAEMIRRIIKMNEYAQHKINKIPFYDGGNYREKSE